MGTDTKNNAKRAMQELFGGRVEDTAAGNENDASFKYEESSVAGQSEGQGAPAARAGDFGTTVIDSGTVITGTVKSNSSIEIRGTVFGDIDCADAIHFYGRIVGNVSCSSFRQYAGAVKGNISAAASIDIEKDGAVKGDIKAKTVQIDGRLCGNLSAQDRIDLLDNAIVAGDVETNYFNMADSSKLRGNVKLLGEDKSIDSAFNGFFDF